jgi:hypothetical protein
MSHMRPGTTTDPGRPWTRGNRLVGYDPRLRRLWVGGQRLHHGATGIALAGITLARLASGRPPARRGLTWFLAGSAMVAHDWKDRAVWFRRGSQAD